MNQFNRLCLMLILALALTNAVGAQTTLFQDDFNSAALDTAKWRRGNNSNVTIQSGSLQIISLSDQTGWIVTKQAIPGNNTSATIKIVQPNLDTDIGICPTLPALTDPQGIYNKPNFYRFYINQSSDSPPQYELFACKRKNNGPQDCTMEGAQLKLSANYGTLLYLRLRLSEGMIFFEYSFDACYWYMMYFEPFDLPGYTTADSFYYEIGANNTPVHGILKADDFKIENYPAGSYSAQPTILDDPLNSSTFNSSGNPGVIRKNAGGSFSGMGWKPSASQPNEDIVYYDLGRYLENGSLEIDVKQFYPEDQNSDDSDIPRHHVLAMFRQPWGGHHAVEKIDSYWDLHTGTDYFGGVKLLSNTYYSCDEFDTRVFGSTESDERLWPKWVKSNAPYHLKVVWDNKSLKYYRNDTLHAWHILSNPMGLRYVYVGRDRTVSADLNTGYAKNQYPTMSDVDGPIYANLKVKEFRSNEAVLPVINQPVVIDRYQNAVRLQWTTNEAAVCSLEYGLTTSYGNKTKVLGPSAQTFTTLLANLNSATLYHYRIIAEDNAGNVKISGDYTFLTANNGVYVFKPVADTYIERNRDGDAGTYSHLYGPTRAFGNYGWMNLMTASGRYAYLKFEVPDSLNNVLPQVLRLYSRQGGQSGVNLYQFNTVSLSWEYTLTWDNQSSVGGQSGNGFQDSNGGIAGPLLGSIASPMVANKWYSFSFSSPASIVPKPEGSYIAYYFALKDTGSTPPGTPKFTQDVSFDSRESNNNQPELIVSTPPTQAAFAADNTITNLPGIEDGDVTWGDYNRDGYMDVVITGLGVSGPVSKLFKNTNNGGPFAEVDTLQPLKYSAADWGDFNMDGILDLLLTGQQITSGQATKVYRNTNISGNIYDLAAYPAPTLIGVKYGDLAWGNYNNDRYLDILLSGFGTASGYATRVYQGDSSGAGGTRNWKHNTSITLPQLQYSSVAWGDNDGDGWLDLLVAGTHLTNNDSIKIFRNKKNSNGTRGFLQATIQLPLQARTASVAWGNFEGEDYLDIAFAGRTNSTTQAYQRTISTYVPVDTMALIDVKEGTVAWGDYDNDGDLDLLVTGEKSNPTARVSKIYRTDKYTKDNIKFVDIGASLTGVYKGAAAWADYDNDGDLDILIAGNTTTDSTGRKTIIYENILNVPNTTPTAPTGLTVTYSATDSLYTLKWNKSTDNQTPQAALTYNVMIGTTSNGTEILSPMANKFTGKRWLPAPGNAGAKDYYLLNRRGLNNGIYYWRVQAIDNIWKGSAFSVEDTFTVPYTLPKAAATDSSAIVQQTIPKTFALSQNYPNPFNPSTRLNLNLPENGRVKAIVFNLIGQEVARLQDGTMTAGYRYLNWEGKNKTGANVSSGIYLVKVVFEGVSGLRKEATSRVLLLK